MVHPWSREIALANDIYSSASEAHDMATDTRERIITASAELFRRQGYAGTGVKQIVAEAQAPFGSIYHHFPGGKEQIGAETILASGAIYGLLIEAVIDPAPDVASGVRD